MTEPAVKTQHAILVVEDDDDIRGALAAFLEAEGYRVVEASNGEEALHLLRSTRAFCLVLLDLYMPVMNGWEFRAAQLRDPAIAEVPVVVVSADRSAGEKAKQLGAVDYMVKPIDFAKLLRSVTINC